MGWYFCSVDHASHTHVQRGPSPALACFCYPERDSVEDERESERERGEGYRGINRGWGEERGQLSVSLFLLCVSDLWGLTPHSRTCGSHKGGELGGSGWRGCRLPVHLHVLKPEVSIAGLAVVELDKRCSGEVGV